MALTGKIKELPDWSKDANHRWADFIELSCLNDLDGYFSLEDMIDHYSDERSEELDRGDEKHSEIYDEFSNKIRDYFSTISFRVTALGENYPFEMNGPDAIVLKRDLTVRHEFYLFLLFASNLWLFRSNLYALTHAFEDISCEILKAISSPRAITHVFGTSRTGVGGLYRGNLRERIRTLAGQLFATPTEMLENDHMYNAPGGDGGLDLVSYIQIDNMPFIPVSFGQCACSQEEWVQKQFSIRRELWTQRFAPLSPYLQFMFVPFYYRNADGEFENRSPITSCLIDRHRIFILAEDSLFQRFTDHDIYEVVKKIISTQNAALRSEV